MEPRMLSMLTLNAVVLVHCLKLSLPTDCARGKPHARQCTWTRYLLITLAIYGTLDDINVIINIVVPGALSASFLCTPTVPPECQVSAWDPQPPPPLPLWCSVWLPFHYQSPCHFLWTNVFLLKKINDVYNPRWVAPLPGAQTMQEGLAQGHHYLHHQCCDDLVCICKTCSLWTSVTSTKATYYFDFSWPCYTGLVCKCCT